MEWKDGNTLLSDYRETILLRFNQYYKASKIFGTIIFVMISLILISFIYRIITGSCVEGYPSYLKYMGYISEGFSTLIIFIFWTGSLKLVIISNKVINLVRSGNFQYSYGQITDKHCNNKRHRAYLYVNNIKGNSITQEDYYGATLGDTYMIINVNNMMFVTKKLSGTF